MNVWFRALFLSVTLLLASCGGDDSDNDFALSYYMGPSRPVDDQNPGTPATRFLKADCEITSDPACGARDDNFYAGTGIGIWRYTHPLQGSWAADVKVSLNNVANQTITLVYTNEDPIYSKALSSSLRFYPALDTRPFYADLAEQRDFFNAIPEAIRQFKAIVPKPVNSPRLLRAPAESPVPLYEVGDWREWNIYRQDYFDKAWAQLVYQADLDANRKINFWVEEGEYGAGKISDQLLVNLFQRFSSVYPDVVLLAGEPWGSYSGAFARYFIPAEQPLNIVLANFHNPVYGVLTYGYFNPADVYLTSFADCAECATSNESLALYLDSATFYRGEKSDGMPKQISIMAHELTHMINYYQRTVLNGNGIYQSFLHEMTAMMMEDIVANKIDPSGRFHMIRDIRFADWMTSGVFNCRITDFELYRYDCPEVDSYSAAGTFGAYLLRHYGIGFYQSLLKDMTTTADLTSTDAEVALIDDVLSQPQFNTPGEEQPSFARALQRWHATVAQLPATGVPQNYGLPEYREGNWYLIGLDGSKREPRLPYVVPEWLDSYGMLPFRRKPTGDTFDETFQVRRGVSLTVIVK